MDIFKLEEVSNYNTAISQAIELLRLAATVNDGDELADFSDFIHYLSMAALKNAKTLEQIKDNAFKEHRGELEVKSA